MVLLYNYNSKIALSVDILTNLIQLPCICLTTIIIWLVDVLARVTMTVPTSRNTFGICETPADFDNTQLKWFYPLSFNADSDSTHSKYMDAQSCTSANTDAREDNNKQKLALGHEL